MAALFRKIRFVAVFVAACREDQTNGDHGRTLHEKPLCCRLCDR
ncbi:hypothetical protein [Rhodanobacter hydrolyticus]